MASQRAETLRSELCFQVRGISSIYKVGNEPGRHQRSTFGQHTHMRKDTYVNLHIHTHYVYMQKQQQNVAGAYTPVSN